MGEDGFPYKRESFKGFFLFLFLSQQPDDLIDVGTKIDLPDPPGQLLVFDLADHLSRIQEELGLELIVGHGIPFGAAGVWYMRLDPGPVFEDQNRLGFRPGKGGIDACDDLPP
jgi:hypothetical protein